jgi:hypothetical protein
VIRWAILLQTITEFTIFVNLTTAVLSAAMAGYVIRLWYRQENRLSTDLPLMFGIMFIGQAVNNVLLALPLAGIFPASLLYFKFRALWIVTTIFPLLGVVVNIWLPRYQHRHNRILGALLLYWILVVVLGPTEEVVMRLHLPVILLLTIAMIVTFSITWRTGRLKEVRSDLLVLTFALGTVGQAVRAILNLDAMTQIFTAIGTVLIVLALVNPWYDRSSRRGASQETELEELESMAQY